MTSTSEKPPQATAAATTTPRRPTWSGRSLDLTVVLAAFVASRLGYYMLGVRFDTTPRAGFWQFLDPQALHEAPLSSLWNLHIQPPLYNALLWLWESVSPFGLTTSARTSYQFMGMLLALCTWQLGRELGLPRWLSVGVAVVVATNPATILYEQWLYTTYPTALLTVALALAAARLWRRGSRVDLALAVSLAAALVLLRSAFHPVWFLVVVVVLGLVALRRYMTLRSTVAVALVPFLLVFGLVAKNMIRFDTPGTSSWMGMSLQKLTTLRLPPDLVAELAAEGVIDPVTATGPFQPFDVYQAKGARPSKPTGVHVLDEQTWTGGQRNLNYKGYIAVDQQMQKDAIVLMRRYPMVYLRGVREALWTYVRPPTCYPFLEPNRSRIRHLDRVWRTAVYGESPTTDGSCPHLEPATDHSGPGVLVMLSLGAVCMAGVVAARGRTRVGRALRQSPAGLFAGALVVYLPLVTSPLELGENQRFRMEVEPLQIVVTAWLLVTVVRACRREPDAAG